MVLIATSLTEALHALLQQWIEEEFPIPWRGQQLPVCNFSRHGLSQKLQPPNTLLQLPIIHEVAKDYDEHFTNMGCSIENDGQGPLENLSLYSAHLFLMYEGYQLPEMS